MHLSRLHKALLAIPAGFGVGFMAAVVLLDPSPAEAFLVGLWLAAVASLGVWYVLLAAICSAADAIEQSTGKQTKPKPPAANPKTVIAQARAAAGTADKNVPDIFK